MGITFEKANKFRVRHGVFGTDDSDITGGYFNIPFGSERRRYNIIVRIESGWEQIVVSTTNKTPTWSVMCKIKEMFWHPDDVVVQYLPAESNYVHQQKYALHLWRQQAPDFPTPKPT